MIVLDTHVLVWWLAQPRNLSAKARRLVKASAAKAEVVVSTISLFEISTLVRRRRLVLTMSFSSWVAALRSMSEINLQPVSPEIALAAGDFDEPFPGDPADRLIAATAWVAGAKLVTADEKLRSVSMIETVW